MQNLSAWSDILESTSNNTSICQIHQVPKPAIDRPVLGCVTGATHYADSRGGEKRKWGAGINLSKNSTFQKIQPVRYNQDTVSAINLTYCNQII